MLVMDGLTATREIRKLPERSDLPIIAMTANAMAFDRQQCMDAGMNDHIAKPIDPNDLIAKLQKWTLNQGRVVAVDDGRPAPEGLPSATELLDGIDGLDVELGLSMVRGRESFYLNILEMFANGQAKAPARIAAAIASADWALAELVAHTLKGVAMQVGARLVRAAVEQLEHAIHERQTSADLEILQEQLAITLDALIAAIVSRLYRLTASRPIQARRDLN